VNDADLHLSAMTLGEIQTGIEMTREQDAAKADEIETWLDRIAETWNVLTLDKHVMRIWARLMHRRSDTAIDDALIAATALAHDLTVVTRNVRDFTKLGVRTLNPFETPRA
jgi:predicted nucleic acid-binding protein